VKIGKEGSIIVSDGKITKVEAFSAKAVDTTGAGDLFAAGFLYAHLKGKSLEDSERI